MARSQTQTSITLPDVLLCVSFEAVAVGVVNSGDEKDGLYQRHFEGLSLSNLEDSTDLLIAVSDVTPLRAEAMRK